MSQYFSIAEYFFKQNRYEESLEQVKKGLNESPENSFLLAFQALCQLKIGLKSDAEKSVLEALSVDINNDFAHYIHANILIERSLFKKAEQKIRNAIDINPIHSEYYGVLALCLYNRHQKEDEIRSTAKTGLSFDPDNSVCRNVLAMIELRAGKKGLATGIMDIQLEKEPNNALSLSNQGWNYLHQGEYEKAEKYFRRALEQDGDNDWARTGLLQVLKTKIPLYKYILKFFLSLSRMSPSKRFGLVFGIYLVFALLTRSESSFGVFAGALFVGYAGFIYLTWLWESLANVVLSKWDKSKEFVTPIEKRNSYILASGLLLTLGLSIGYWITGQMLLMMAAVGCFLLSIPLTIVLHDENKNRRRWTLGLIGGLFLFGAGFLATPLIVGEAVEEVFSPLMTGFVFAIFALTCYLFFFRSRR